MYIGEANKAAYTVSVPSLVPSSSPILPGQPGQRGHLRWQEGFRAHWSAVWLRINLIGFFSKALGQEQGSFCTGLVSRQSSTIGNSRLVLSDVHLARWLHQQPLWHLTCRAKLLALATGRAKTAEQGEDLVVIATASSLIVHLVDLPSCQLLNPSPLLGPGATAPGLPLLAFLTYIPRKPDLSLVHSTVLY